MGENRKIEGVKIINLNIIFTQGRCLEIITPSKLCLEGRTSTD